jgi:hypothetical protein
MASKYSKNKTCTGNIIHNELLMKIACDNVRTEKMHRVIRRLYVVLTLWQVSLETYIMGFL